MSTVVSEVGQIYLRRLHSAPSIAGLGDQYFGVWRMMVRKASSSCLTRSTKNSRDACSSVAATKSQTLPRPAWVSSDQMALWPDCNTTSGVSTIGSDVSMRDEGSPSISNPTKQCRPDNTVDEARRHESRRIIINHSAPSRVRSIGFAISSNIQCLLPVN